MLTIVQALGWPIWPLIVGSVIALALIIERFIALRETRVVPPRLLDDVLTLRKRGRVAADVLLKLEASAPLGRVLAAALRNEMAGRESATMAVLAAGTRAGNELSRYLTLLGSIGSLAPLLGLFGTVVGMIEIFAGETAGANPQQLAHGISLALYSTAFGILVAVPAIMCHRYFRSRVEDFLVEMEQQSQQLIEHLFTPVAHDSPR